MFYHNYVYNYTHITIIIYIYIYIYILFVCNEDISEEKKNEIDLNVFQLFHFVNIFFFFK